MRTLALPALLAAGLAGGVAACGGSSAPAPAAEPAVTVIATPRSNADDAEVARVNGHPVWASCIAAQAAHVAPVDSGSADQVRRAALDQCVAFELLAQAAEARGLAGDPSVREAARGAEVNRLVETGFEQRYRTAADLGPSIEPLIKRNEWRMHLIQLRASAFARFKVAKGAPPEVDARARALAEQLARQLAGQTGLYPVHLSEAARALAATSPGVELDASTVKPTYQGDLVAAYASALYAIPAIGQTSPAVRTQWGWDVVLWTGGVEPKDITRDQLVAEMFPDLLRHQFVAWSTQLGRQLGVHIEVDDANVARLDTDLAGGP